MSDTDSEKIREEHSKSIQIKSNLFSLNIDPQNANTQSFLVTNISVRSQRVYEIAKWYVGSIVFLCEKVHFVWMKSVFAISD